VLGAVVRSPRQRGGKARRSHPRMAQVPASQSGAGAHRQVGRDAGGAGSRLFPAADENQVGKLQSPGKAPAPQYRTGEKAQGPFGIRHRSRNGAPH